MMCGTVEIQILERWRTSVMCQDSRKKWIIDIFAQLHCDFSNKLANSVRILLIMGYNYVIIKLKLSGVF
jgi:hypothetical protein